MYTFRGEREEKEAEEEDEEEEDEEEGGEEEREGEKREGKGREKKQEMQTGSRTPGLYFQMFSVMEYSFIVQSYRLCLPDAKASISSEQIHQFSSVQLLSCV